MFINVYASSLETIEAAMDLHHAVKSRSCIDMRADVRCFQI